MPGCYYCHQIVFFLICLSCPNIQAGFIDTKLPVAKVRPSDFEDAAKRACESNMENGISRFPDVSADNLPYLCMDLVYQFTLLVDGFGE